MTNNLLTFLASIPRPIVALVALAIYGAIVRWQFRAPMLIDAALIGLYLFRPSLGLLAWVALLMFVRNTPTMAREVVLLFRLAEYDGWTQRAVVFALPACSVDELIMSNEDDEELVWEVARTGANVGQTSSLEAVLPHQPQLEPDSSLAYEPVPAPPSLHRMSRAEEIAMLTVQRNDDGSYRHSANKIAELMGGTAADVKSQVAAIRGPAKPAQPPAQARVIRPANGWKNSAS